MFGGACFAPQIVKFVAAELKDTAKIDKQAKEAKRRKPCPEGERPPHPPVDATPKAAEKNVGKGRRRQ